MIRRRHKVLIVIGGLWVLLLTAVSLIPAGFFLDSFRQLESERSARALQTLQERLDSEFDHLRTNLVTWAYWDDAYQAMLRMTPAFISSNLSEPSIFDFGMNFILFVDRKGNIKLGRHYDLEKGKRLSMPTRLPEFVKSNPAFWNTSPTTFTKGLASFNDKIYFLAALPILTGEKKGPPSGTLIFGRLLSKKFVSELARKTSFEIELVRPDAPAPHSHQTTLIDVPLQSIEGPILGVIRASFPQTILAQGLASLKTLTAWLWLAGLLFALGVLAYLERQVFPRIDRAEYRALEMERLNTQLKKAQLHLVQTQKFDAVSALAKGIAHDFNNLLSSIFGAISVLERDYSGNQEISKRLEVISRAAEKASELTKKLVRLSRREGNEKETFSISEIVTDVQSSLSKSARHEIRIRTDIPRNLWKIEGERSALFQVLMNLGMNAVDSIPAEGEIVFHVENVTMGEKPSVEGLRPGPYVRVKVVDTGVGIPSEAQLKVFDPFVTTKGDGSSLGLGLSVAYSIAREHGGLLTCYSEPNLGSIFSLYIPAADPEPAIELKPLEFHEDKVCFHEPFNGRLILIADDDYLMRETARDILEEEGAVVLTADSGVSALDTFSKHHDQLSLVILDVIMPELGGIEVVQKIRDTGANIPVIFTSGGTDSKITPLLAKPFKRKELLEMVWSEIKNYESKLKAHA